MNLVQPFAVAEAPAPSTARRPEEESENADEPSASRLAARTTALISELKRIQGSAHPRSVQTGAEQSSTARAWTSGGAAFSHFRPSNHKLSRFQNCFGQDPQFFGNFMQRIQRD